MKRREQQFLTTVSKCTATARKVSFKSVRLDITVAVVLGHIFQETASETGICVLEDWRCEGPKRAGGEVGYWPQPASWEALELARRVSVSWDGEVGFCTSAWTCHWMLTVPRDGVGPWARQLPREGLSCVSRWHSGSWGTDCLGSEGGCGQWTTSPSTMFLTLPKIKCVN